MCPKVSIVVLSCLELRVECVQNVPGKCPECVHFGRFWTLLGGGFSVVFGGLLLVGFGVPVLGFGFPVFPGVCPAGRGWRPALHRPFRGDAAPAGGAADCRVTSQVAAKRRLLADIARSHLHGGKQRRPSVGRFAAPRPLITPGESRGSLREGLPS